MVSAGMAAICGNSLGAVLRLEDETVKGNLMQLCGGEGQGITADRLSDLLAKLDALKGPRAVKPAG
jgi:hypothetical protein